MFKYIKKIYSSIMLNNFNKSENINIYEKKEKNVEKSIKKILEDSNITNEEGEKLIKNYNKQLEGLKKDTKNNLKKHLKDVIVTNIAKKLIDQIKLKKNGGKIEYDNGIQIDGNWEIFDTDTFFNENIEKLFSKIGIDKKDIFKKIYSINPDFLQNDIKEENKKDINEFNKKINNTISDTISFLERKRLSDTISFLEGKGLKTNLTNSKIIIKYKGIKKEIDIPKMNNQFQILNNKNINKFKDSITLTNEIINLFPNIDKKIKEEVKDKKAINLGKKAIEKINKLLKGNGIDDKYIAKLKDGKLIIEKRITIGEINGKNLKNLENLINNEGELEKRITKISGKTIKNIDSIENNNYNNQILRKTKKLIKKAENILELKKNGINLKLEGNNVKISIDKIETNLMLPLKNENGIIKNEENIMKIENEKEFYKWIINFSKKLGIKLSEKFDLTGIIKEEKEKITGKINGKINYINKNINEKIDTLIDDITYSLENSKTRFKKNKDNIIKKITM